MTYHFIQLLLEGKRKYKTKVFTEGCTDAIKKTFIKCLDSYDSSQLILLQPDGFTEIHPQTPITDLKGIPMKPMIAIVKDPFESIENDQSIYKSDISCIQNFNALAQQLALFYEFEWESKFKFPIMSDVLKAVSESNWKYQMRSTTLKERLNKDGTLDPPKEIPLLSIPLCDLFNESEWDKIRKLYENSYKKLDSFENEQEHFIILYRSDFTIKTIRFFKRIGINGKLFLNEYDVMVKNETLLD